MKEDNIQNYVNTDSDIIWKGNERMGNIRARLIHDKPYISGRKYE